jgi:hypothetical protein
MRKYTWVLLFLLITTIAYAASTTTNYSLYKPGVGDTGWGNLINANFDTIDSQMKTNADGISSNSSSISTNTSNISTNSSNITTQDSDDVEDGDFSENGIMTRDGSGSYGVTNSLSELDEDLSLTGTADGTSFLAGDGAWKRCVDITGSEDLCDGSDDGAGGGGTDDQTIDVLSFSTPNISISLEDDGEATKTLDISGLNIDPDNLNDEDQGDVNISSDTWQVQEVQAGAISEITDIDADHKTGSDDKLVTGTAGSNGHCAEWNADGDLVTAGAACGSGSGDVESVGDCADGACYDGTSDGGTYMRLYDGDSNYTELNNADANQSADLKWVFPNSNGTAGQVLEIASVNSNTITLEWDNDNESAGSNTAYDDIDDPDANGSINMGQYTGTYTSIYNGGWEGMFIHHDGFPTASTELLTLKFTEDTSDAPTVPLLTWLSLQDNNGDVVYSFDQDSFDINEGRDIVLDSGDITLSSGDLSVGDDLTVTDDVDVNGFIDVAGTINVTGKVYAEGVELGAGGGTDDQTIDVFSISGNNVQLSLEDDGEATKTVDISTTTAVTANTAKVSCTSANVGSASDNLDNTDASVEWEDATDLDSNGALNTGSVADNEIDYSAVTLDDFDYQTNWRLFYSNGSGDVTELAFGTDGQVLTSTGASTAPAFEDATGGAQTPWTQDIDSADYDLLMSGTIYNDAGALDLDDDVEVGGTMVVGGSSSGIGFTSTTSDPCGSAPEGYIFYNGTSSYPCYCDGSGDDVKLTDNTTACF